MYTLKNNVQLIGRLGTAPEIKNFDNGKKKVNINLATNESYKNSEGKKVEETQWHKLVGWGKIAELVEKYTDKGSEIGVSGKLVYRTYDDKNGDKRTITEVQINELLLLGK